jgi:hypothetical protein
MSGRARTMVAVVLGLFIAGAAAADTLELKDGRVLQGRYLGGTQAVLRFEIKGEVQTFNVSDAVALTFTGTSSATEAPASAPQSAATPLPAPAASAPKTSRPRPPDPLRWRPGLPEPRTLLLNMAKSPFRLDNRSWCA